MIDLATRLARLRRLGLAGPIALVRGGRWTQDQDVVFVHTGGAPALFAYRHLFQE